MSIIIRLQNLPWSASSSDIRYFFRGLEIPDGGVHIIGGDKGEACIAFQTDDDARLAMQKSGLRLKGSYVKLILSSKSEMQQLIEEVRLRHECGAVDHSSERPKSSKCISRQRSRESSWSPESHRPSSSKRSRRSHSSSTHKSSRRQSHPEKYSKNIPRSYSPYHKNSNDGKHSKFKGHSRKRESLEKYDHRAPLQQKAYPEVKFIDSSELYDRRSPIRICDPIPSASFFSHHDADPNICNFNEQSPIKEFQGTSESIFEPHSLPIASKCFDKDNYEHSICHPNRLIEDRWVNDKYESVAPGMFSDQNKSLPQRRPTSFGHSMEYDHAFNAADPAFDDTSSRKDVRSSGRRRLPNYCVQLCGFPRNATFKDVQTSLKRIYAPQRNIKWNVSNRGYKTGTAYVRLSNQDDFNEVLSGKEFSFDGLSIHVSRCPDETFYDLFIEDEQYEYKINDPSDRSNDFCYMLKGLPYATTEDDVLNFFTGLSLEDLVILYDKNGKATGTGYVQFSNLEDYNIAFERDGKKIGHRYIELLKSNREDVDDAKNTAVAVSRPMSEILNERMFENRSRSFKQNALQKRPLCVVLSGLPFDINASRLFAFFKDCGIRPDAVHIVFNESNHCPSGRAFAEFLEYFDLDVALKQHGKFIGEHMVSVKQMLFEEMMKILSTHPVVHDFGVAFKKENSGPLPEKLPYIWEPPDGSEDQRHSTTKGTRINNIPFKQSSNPQFYNENFSHQEYSAPQRNRTEDLSGAHSFDKVNVYGRAENHDHQPNWFASEDSPVRQKTFANSWSHLDSNFTPQSSHTDRDVLDGRLKMHEENLRTSDPRDELRNYAGHFENQNLYHHDQEAPSVVLFSDHKGNNQRGFSDHAFTQATFGFNDHIANEASIQNETWGSHPNPFGQEVSFPYDTSYSQPDELRHFGECEQQSCNNSSSFDSRKPFNSNRSAQYISTKTKHPSESYQFNQSQNSGRDLYNIQNPKQHKNQRLPTNFNKKRGRQNFIQIKTNSSPVSEGKARNPIKFGVRSRQSVTTNEELKDAFDPTLKNEDKPKSKLKKLSPEVSLVVGTNKSSPKSDPKAEKSEKKPEAEVKEKTVACMSDSACLTQQDKETKQNVSNENGSKLEKGSSPPSENLKGKDDKYVDNQKNDILSKKKKLPGNDSEVKPQKVPTNERKSDSDSGKRSHDANKHNRNRKRYKLSSSSNFQNRYTNGKITYEGCTIQVSNVPPYCGLSELLHFFRGFRIHGEDIIRRFTDSGEPTGDVRVTLVNVQEAERAIILLNDQLLGGVPVSLFSV